MYNNFEEMIEQIEKCKFECEAGFLENNTGWIALKSKLRQSLSSYMPSHLDLGDKDCCGIFDSINDDGIAECNECGMSINNAIKELTEEYKRRLI